MAIIEGLAGSKPMAKAAGDVHTVNIQWLTCIFDRSDGGKKKERIIGFALLPKDWCPRKIPALPLMETIKGDKILWETKENSFEEPSEKSF